VASRPPDRALGRFLDRSVHDPLASAVDLALDAVARDEGRSGACIPPGLPRRPQLDQHRELALSRGQPITATSALLEVAGAGRAGARGRLDLGIAPAARHRGRL
jgi:hypothetical protein